MRRTVLLVLFPTLAATGAWSLLDRAEEPLSALEPILVCSGGDETASPAQTVEPLLRGASHRRHPRHGTRRLVGRVLHEGRAHAARVTLHVRDEDHLDLLGSEQASVVAAGDGAFCFTCAPNGRCTVIARASDGLAGRARAFVRADETRVVVELAGGPGVLAGRAVCADGTPWRGRVAVVGAKGGVTPCLDGDFIPTDVEGRFRFVRLPVRPVRLVAYDTGAWLLRTPAIELPYVGEYLLQVDEARTPLQGVVVEVLKGARVAGATVVAVSRREGDGCLTATTTSDEDGAFRVDALPGRTDLEVASAGYVTARRRASLDDPAVRVEMLRRGRILGRVLDEEERLLAGVKVQAVATRYDPRYRKIERVATSDHSGRFTITDAEPGAWNVLVLGGGWTSRSFGTGRRSPNRVEVPSDGEGTVDLVVQLGARVRGIVRDASGAPVRGATVTPDYGRGLLSRLKAPETKTDAEGRFDLGSIAPARKRRVRASAPGVFHAASRSFEAKGGEVAEVEIELPPARSVEILVVESEAQTPVRSARVCLDAAEHGVDFYEVERTDADGRVVVDALPPGVIEIAVRTEDHVSANTNVPATERGHVERTIRLETSTGIGGQVVFPGGLPVGGMRVYARQGREHTSCVTGEDGAFELDGLGSGDWSLALATPETRGFKGSGVESPILVSAGTHGLVLEVPDTLARPLEITVLDPEGSRVHAFEARCVPRTHRPRAGKDGLLSLPLGHRVVWMEIHHATDVLGRTLPYAPIPVGPLHGDEREIRVRFRRSASIAGCVRDPGGAAVSRVRVSAYPVHRAGLPPGVIADAHATVGTTDDGAFVLQGLAEGAYRLVFHPPDTHGDTTTQVVLAGAANVVAVVERATAATLRVVDDRGLVVAGAKVRLTRNRGDRTANAKTDKSGEVVVSTLDPGGRYELTVNPPTHRGDLATLERTDWMPSSGTLVLQAVAGIRGRVVSAAGRRVSGARVEARPENGGGPRWTHSRGDGSFCIGGLARGAHVLAVGKRSGSAFLASSARAEVGDHDVLLVLEEGPLLTVRLRNAPHTAVGKTVWLRGSNGGSSWCRGVVERDLSARFRPDPGQTWQFTHWLREDGLVAWRPNIDAHAGVVEVAFRPAFAIRGSATWPLDSALPEVVATAPGIRRKVRVARDGTFLLDGLPPQTFTVLATCESPAGRHRAEEEVEAGESVRLDLR